MGRHGSPARLAVYHRPGVEVILTYNSGFKVARLGSNLGGLVQVIFLVSSNDRLPGLFDHVLEHGIEVVWPDCTHLTASTIAGEGPGQNNVLAKLDDRRVCFAGFVFWAVTGAVPPV